MANCQFEILRNKCRTINVVVVSFGVVVTSSFQLSAFNLELAIRKFQLPSWTMKRNKKEVRNNINKIVKLSPLFGVGTSETSRFVSFIL